MFRWMGAVFKLSYKNRLLYQIKGTKVTHDYKAALEVFNRLIPSLEHSLEQKLREFHNNEPIDDMLVCIRSALQLAQEAEQVRKERDELAKEVVYLNAVCGNCVEVKYLLKTINLAKKVIENGNA